MRRHPQTGQFVRSRRPALAELQQKPQQAQSPPGGKIEDIKTTNADRKFAAAAERPQPQSRLIPEVES